MNALGRGQDAEALGLFLQTIAQTIGPEAIGQYVNTDEVIKRLATAQGIDVLNLIKTQDQMQGESQQQQAQAEQMELTKQAGQFAQVEQKREENAIQQDAGSAPSMKPRASRSRKKPTATEAPRTEEVAENTLSKMAEKEPAEIKVGAPEPNKYAPKKKVGTPTLGRSLTT